MKQKLLAVLAALKSKGFLTVLTVIIFFAWGTLAWFTGNLLMADRLELLSLIRLATYGAAVAAVFLRSALRRVSDEVFLIVGSALCVVGLVLMTRPGLLPVGYLLVGLTRIILIPANLGFVSRVLGPKGATITTAGAFYLANAVLSPVIAWLVKRQMWRIGLWVAVFLVVSSVATTWLARPTQPQVETEGNKEEAQAAPNLRALGEGTITFVGIQLTFGILALAVFPLAEATLGELEGAGSLEAMRQIASLIGVLATLSYRGSFNLRFWLGVQALGLVSLALGVRFAIPSLVYFGLVVDGVAFSVLERASEVAYLTGLQGLPSSGVVIQALDAATRISIGAGELFVAFTPLYVSLYCALALPLMLILLLNWPAAKRTIARRLYAVARKE